MESEQPEKDWLFIRPARSYASGTGPTEVEYELTLPSGEVKTLRAPINGAIEIETARRIRYRFLWGDQAGAWRDVVVQ
jgi:hypothetical protein